MLSHWVVKSAQTHTLAVRSAILPWRVLASLTLDGASFVVVVVQKRGHWRTHTST
jgi:hypothetical protein